MIARVRENQLVQLRPAQTGDGTFLTRLGQSDVLARRWWNWIAGFQSETWFLAVGGVFTGESDQR